MAKIVAPQPLFDNIEHLAAAPHSAMPLLAQRAEWQREYALALEFLRSYRNSLDTFTAYRREVERLLQWRWLLQGKPLQDINRNDIRDYLVFIKNPPAAWVGTKTVARFLDNHDGERVVNPEWRPFVVRVNKLARAQGQRAMPEHYDLSAKSIAAIFAILGSFFVFLQQEQYLMVNPISLLRQKKSYVLRQQQHKITRKLSKTQWQFVLAAAQAMAANDPQHERTLFLVAAFYLLGLRISELSYGEERQALMNNFAPDKHGRWWYTTVGKGNKMRDVAVPDDLLTMLKRYRQHLGLHPLPGRGEATPLIPASRGKRGLGSRQIRNVLQAVFDQAIARLRAEGHQDESDDLASATVHWLRHTAISDEVALRPREHIRDDVGHENPATMEQYIDTDRIARHNSAQVKRLNRYIN